MIDKATKEFYSKFSKAEMLSDSQLKKIAGLKPLRKWYADGDDCPSWEYTPKDVWIWEDDDDKEHRWPVASFSIGIDEWIWVIKYPEQGYGILKMGDADWVYLKGWWNAYGYIKTHLFRGYYNDIAEPIKHPQYKEYQK